MGKGGSGGNRGGGGKGAGSGSNPLAKKQLKSLIERYRKAQAELRDKQRATRQAAARALEFRLKIDRIIRLNNLDVYRAVFAVEPDRTKGRASVRLIAFGKNLDVSAVQGRGEVVDFTGADCGDVCNEAVDVAVQEMANEGLTPGMDISCVCQCYEGGGAMGAMAECFETVEA